MNTSKLNSEVPINHLQFRNIQYKSESNHQPIGLTSHQKFLLSVDGECTNLEDIIDLANDNMPILTEYQNQQIQDMVDSIELDLQREVKYGNVKDSVEDDDLLFSDNDFDFKFRKRPSNKEFKNGNKDENPLQRKIIKKDFEFDINLDNLMTIKEEKAVPKEVGFISENNFQEFFKQVQIESGHSEVESPQKKPQNLRFKQTGKKRRQDLFYEKSRHCEAPMTPSKALN